LKGSMALERIEDHKEDLLLEYENVCRCIPELARYTYAEFVWARLAVLTRIFGLEIGTLQTDGLVPMADMLNHKRPRETSWTFDNKRNSFTITTLKQLLRGEPIYDSYGPKCNSRFLVNYGFALEHNEDNQCQLHVAIPTTDPHYALKLRLLGGYASNARRRFHIPIQYSEKETRECFSFVRFALATEEEILKAGGGKEAGESSAEFKVDEIEPLSIRNEMATLRALSTAAVNEMKGFDTTIEDDTKLLRDPTQTFSFNIRNCIILRRGEKEVLKYYLEMAQHCMPILEMKWVELEPLQNRYIHGRRNYDDYVSTVIIPLVKARDEVKTVPVATPPPSAVATGAPSVPVAASVRVGAPAVASSVAASVGGAPARAAGSTS